MNDWIEWKWSSENKCPVKDTTLVEVLFANGDKCDFPAGHFAWKNDFDELDGHLITHYRLLRDDEE